MQELEESLLKQRNRVRELEEALDDSVENYKQAVKLAESRVITIEVLKGQLENLQAAYSEERAERRDLQKQILTFTGVIPKEYKEEEHKEVKFEPVSHARTRGSVRRALEKRAQDILDKQKAREDEAIAGGELAVVETN